MPMIYVRTDLYNEVVRKTRSDAEAQKYVNDAVEEKLKKEKD